MQHEITLFAEDLVALLNEPSLSVPALLEIYGRISEYLTNESKSAPMMITRICLAQLKERINFKWTDGGFRYMGEFITPCTSQISVQITEN